jgi:hypothetical protein
MISTPNKKKEPKKPIILFFNSNFNLELLNVLSEGLVCSGYIALQLDLRINWNLKTLIKTKTADNPVHGEIYSCVSALLDFLTQTNLLKHPHYLIVKFGKSDLPYEALMNDPNNKGIILLNPKRRAIFRNLSSFHSLTERKKVLLLFSYIPYLLFKYRFSLTQLKTAANELLVLKNALYSFKHHETILLGLILKFINHGTKNT